MEIKRISDFKEQEKSLDKHDSTKSTMEHIEEVRRNIAEFNRVMSERASVHDASKLKSPEKEGFDENDHKLATLKYGTPEYKQSLKDLEKTLEHHYKHNTHHPQHYKDGIDGMDLFDVVEMLMDWMASVKRYDGGDIKKSLEINRKRFKMSPQLYNIFKNTIKNWNE